MSRVRVSPLRPTKKRLLSADKRRFFERCVPLRKNVMCPAGVMSALPGDVRFMLVRNTCHHFAAKPQYITHHLRRRRKHHQPSSAVSRFVDCIWGVKLSPLRPSFPCQVSLFTALPHAPRRGLTGPADSHSSGGRPCRRCSGTYSRRKEPRSGPCRIDRPAAPRPSSCAAASGIR